MIQPVTTTDFPALTLKHRGKVRDMYEIPGHDDKLLMIATDRISAYDVIMDEAITGKGIVLTQLSLFWFDLLGDIVENHLITADVDLYPEECKPYAEQLRGRSMLVKRPNPLLSNVSFAGISQGHFGMRINKIQSCAVFNYHKGCGSPINCLKFFLLHLPRLKLVIMMKIFLLKRWKKLLVPTGLVRLLILRSLYIKEQLITP